MSQSYPYSYATGPYPNRPAILTAVAIVSIVAASLSMLVNLAGLLVAKEVSRLATRRVLTPPAAVVSPPPGFTSANSEYVAPRGLSRSQRQIVIDGLSQVRPISDTRQKQLDGLLADVGKDIIRLSDENITPDRIASYVTDSRDMPAGGGGPADDLFVLGSGRLQISDQSAVYFPDNSPSPIRSRGGSYTDAQGSHLASEQIAAIVDRVQNLCGHAMNDAQVQSLESELESTSQTLISPSLSVAQAAEQILSAQGLGDGTIAVTTNNASMSFSPTGQTYPGIMAMSTWQASATTPRVARRDAALLMLETLASFAAAGFLLACGIMLLRNSPHSRWMILGYSIGKLLLVGLSCYAIYSVAVALNPSDPNPGSTATAWMLIVGATGAIYPIILLIVINLRFVREFLATPTVARIY
jgi:hypothetical protein